MEYNEVGHAKQDIIYDRGTGWLEAGLSEAFRGWVAIFVEQEPFND